MGQRHWCWRCPESDSVLVVGHVHPFFALASNIFNRHPNIPSANGQFYQFWLITSQLLVLFLLARGWIYTQFMLFTAHLSGPHCYLLLPVFRDDSPVSTGQMDLYTVHGVHNSLFWVLFAHLSLFFWDDRLVSNANGSIIPSSWNTLFILRNAVCCSSLFPFLR